MDKIHVYKTKEGQWRWKRVSRNGKIVGASTESYKSRRDAEANIFRQREFANWVVEK